MMEQVAASTVQRLEPKQRLAWSCPPSLCSWVLSRRLYQIPVFCLDVSGGLDNHSQQDSAPQNRNFVRLFEGGCYEEKVFSIGCSLVSFAVDECLVAVYKCDCRRYRSRRYRSFHPRRFGYCNEQWNRHR